MTELVSLTKKEDITQEENILLEKMEFEISPAALKQAQLASIGDEHCRYTIRIGLRGGGCSGFTYLFEFIDETEIDPEEDLVEEIEGIKFVMDVLSQQYLKGSMLDFKSSLQETGFKFINEKISKSCGCGKSVAF